MSDERINALWRGYGILLARQEAVEYLTVEMIAARFLTMSEAEIKAECDRLTNANLSKWPPVWDKTPMELDARDEALALMLGVTRAILDRAAQRAEFIALESGIEAAKRRNRTATDTDMGG